MIHLAIDTDVWLWLICHRLDAEDNHFDELIFWLQTGKLRCIVPENILKEWERNKESKIGYVKRELSKANQLNKEIFKDPKFFNTIYNATNFEAFGKARIEKVEEIFKDYSEIAPLNDQIKLQAAERTLSRIAPNHEKDSYSDTVNILSLIEHIRSKSISPVIFTTKNFKDYSDATVKQLPHEQLKELFDSVGLEYIYDTEYLFGKRLRPVLPDFKQHLQEAKTLLAQKDLEKRKQEQDKLTNADQDFIGNSLTIDHITEQPKPTQFQQKTIKELIGSDENCRKYFFSKIRSSFWFFFLQEHHYLDPASHPLPQHSSEGTYTARWEILTFLEKIAENISHGMQTELIGPLLEFITTVSKSKPDNDLTYAALIRVLSHLPKTDITLEMLNNMPVWLSGSSNKMMQTSAICSKLLPRFLEEDPDATDSRKAGLILTHLFGISKSGVWVDHTIEKGDSSYYPNAYPSILIDTLITKNLIQRVAERCSPSLFYQLAKTLKLLLLDYSRGLNLQLKNHDVYHTVGLVIELPDLILFTVPQEEGEILQKKVIANYDQMENKTLQEHILNLLVDFEIPYEDIPENQDAIHGVIFALTVDRLSMAGSKSIREMGERASFSPTIKHTLGLVLTKYLDAASKHNPDQGKEMSLRIFTDYQYRLPFFKRIVLHNICLNFKQQKKTFLSFISNEDPYSLFSDYLYRTELFELLKNNQAQFTKKELKLLEKIIDLGPKEERAEEQAKEYWQSRWALALNQTGPFDKLYASLKNKLNIKDRDIDPTNTLKFHNASIAPMSTTDLLEMDDVAIIEYFLSFRPKDNWEKPNVSGLTGILDKAIAENPEKFISSISIYLPLPYIYIHHLLYALKDVGQKDPDRFNWSALLGFCFAYIDQQDFGSTERLLGQDRWSANKNWVLAVISTIISEICRHDDYIAEHRLLPICRKTLLLIDKELNPQPGSEAPQNKDYISKSFNSDSGKFLRACIDYNLCQARASNMNVPEWDQVFASIYEKYLEVGDSDAYTIIGNYWPQFNYLNSKWLHDKINSFLHLGKTKWDAFMGGFIFSAVPSTDETFALFLPHYLQAVKTTLEIKSIGNNGLANHITTLYFWEMDGLEEQSITNLYLSQMPIKAIKDLLHSIWFNDSYLKSLSKEERAHLETRIVALVNHLHRIYELSTEVEIIEMRRETVNIIYMIESLNSANTEIIKTAMGLGSKQYHFTDKIEKLFKLTKKGHSEETAIHLAAILEMMNFGDHLMDDDEKQLETMIQFLYDNKQHQIANKLCNRLSQSGHLFAKTLFLKNTG